MFGLDVVGGTDGANVGAFVGICEGVVVGIGDGGNVS